MSLRNYFNSIEPNFQKGGKYEKYYPIFEMIETIFFTSNTVTKVAPHARSFVDMKRVMTYVVISTIPCVMWALYNTGLQTNTALSSLNLNEISGWRISLLLKDNQTLIMISAVKSLQANFKFDIAKRKLELYPSNGKFDFIISSFAKNCGHSNFEDNYKCSLHKPLISSNLIN